MAGEGLLSLSGCVGVAQTIIRLFFIIYFYFFCGFGLRMGGGESRILSRGHLEPRTIVEAESSD